MSRSPAHNSVQDPVIQRSHAALSGISRRELLQVGYSGFLGLGLPSVLGATQRSPQGVSGGGAAGLLGRAEPIANQPSGKPKQVLIIFLTGAASHHDTFDMKPEAPAEVRGEFKPIATSVPGWQVCEHLPRLAQRAHKYALVRSFSHSDNNHLMSTHYVLTGELQPGGFFDKVASRTDWPCYSAGVAYLRPPQDGLPSGVNLPTYLLEGPLTWPGQHAGLLGAKYDPWQIVGDPNAANFKVDHLSLGGGLDVQRLTDRQQLLTQVNQQQQRLAELAVSQRLSAERDLALSLLTSQRLSRAFELGRETDQLRDQYGRHTTGQSLLLARRLIEVGVPVVQVNIGRVQNWDNHGNIFPTLKDRLLPPLDQGVAALLDDLEQRGLLTNTLVAMFGEFGRTPKINNQKGRDHWGPCFFGLFAGGGVQAGKVIGKSDKEAAYPATRPYSPHDLGATIYDALGIAPDTEVRDRLNRPVRLNRGEVIESLYGGADV